MSEQAGVNLGTLSDLRTYVRPGSANRAAGSIII
jgi:hypothetical protein